MSRNALLFAAVAVLFAVTGMMQSWNLALTVMNMALVSAILALGVNIQWGYAGLFNVGVMGFVALGGLAVVLVSAAPVPEAWAAGGPDILLALLLGAATIAGTVLMRRMMAPGRARALVDEALDLARLFTAAEQAELA
ncbi:MAG TPA: branched-chain amino acid ABC transporter permease, partial [Paracoccaceae bacterium]|nr:branched-chain amino acid ABC transporter permease [Paracoccaceae bacterium]